MVNLYMYVLPECKKSTTTNNFVSIEFPSAKAIEAYVSYGIVL